MFTQDEDIYGRRCNQIAELCFPISYKEKKTKFEIHNNYHATISSIFVNCI